MTSQPPTRLHQATFAHNNDLHPSLKATPFRYVYSDPRLADEVESDVRNGDATKMTPAAYERRESFRAIKEELSENLRKAIEQTEQVLR